MVTVTVALRVAVPAAWVVTVFRAGQQKVTSPVESVSMSREHRGQTRPNAAAEVVSGSVRSSSAEEKVVVLAPSPRRRSRFKPAVSVTVVVVVTVRVAE